MKNWVYDRQKQCYVFKDGGIIKADTGWTAYLNPKNWGVSREYEKDENGNMRSFNEAYGAARKAGEKEFLYNGKRYTTDYKYVPAATQDKTNKTKSIDFSGIVTTSNRSYDPKAIAYINDKLSSIPALQRAAILANIIEESGGDPLATYDDGKNQYYGLLQWGPGRYTFKNNDSQQELDNQIQYILDTLDNTTDRMSWHHGGEGSGYKRAQDAHDAFRNTDIPVDSVNWAYTLGYVRPSGKAESAKNRSKVAQQVYQRIK